VAPDPRLAAGRLAAALLLAPLLPTAAVAQAASGCRAELEHLIRAVGQDAAWPEVEAEFTERSGRALVLALRGDEAGCIALLTDARAFLAGRGITPAPAAPPVTTYVTPPGPATVYRFGTEEDATLRRYVPRGAAAPEPLELRRRAPAAPPVAVALPAEPILVREVGFGFDEARLTEEARAVLRQVAQAARSLRDPQVLLTGHADTSGPAGYNLRLSARRVAAVREALREAGVPEGAIRTRHAGEARPEQRTGDGVREAANRRVEIRVLDGG